MYVRGLLGWGAVQDAGMGLGLVRMSSEVYVSVGLNFFG